MLNHLIRSAIYRHGINHDLNFSLSSSPQLWAAPLRRIRTPTCATSRRGRRTTSTGCCFGRTVHRMPAPTCCGVSPLYKPYLLKKKEGVSFPFVAQTGFSAHYFASDSLKVKRSTAAATVHESAFSCEPPCLFHSDFDETPARVLSACH